MTLSPPSSPLAWNVYGTTCQVQIDPALEVWLELASLERDLLKEFDCFPPTSGESSSPPIEIHLEKLPAEEDPESFRIRQPGFAAHVTEEFLVTLDPRTRASTIWIHRAPRADEVVVATWARLVTALRFGDSPPLPGFHGATWRSPQGGILVLGESGAGKTTLSQRLALSAKASFGYLGDEDAVLRPTSAGYEILPLPRRLRLLGGKARGLPGRPFEAFGEGGWLVHRPALGPLHPVPLTRVLILSPQEETSASGPRVESLEGTQASFSVLEHLERFPFPKEASAEIRGPFADAQRAGFEAANWIASNLPVERVRFQKPQDYPLLERFLRENLGAGCIPGFGRNSFGP